MTVGEDVIWTIIVEATLSALINRIVISIQVQHALLNVNSGRVVAKEK